MTELMTVGKVKRDEEQFITDLIETKGENLPANIEEVLSVFEFTDWKAKAWKTLADKMGKLDEQTEAYHSALRSGQQWGIAALYAQKRMGEITRDIKGPGSDWATSGRSEVGTKETQLNEKGIGKTLNSTRHIYTDAERIAANPEILDQVIESAKKHGDIPTKTSVLNRIRMESAKEYGDKRKEREQEKISKTIPKIVADHYEWVKLSKPHLDLVIAGAKHGKFDPAGKNFMIKKHDEIRNKLKEIEEAIQ